MKSLLSRRKALTFLSAASIVPAAAAIAQGIDPAARGLAVQAKSMSSPFSVSITGGGVTLSPDQAQRAYLRLIGALTADATITLPVTAQVQKIRNDTTGAFALWVKRGASGVPLQIHQNETVEVR